MLGTWPEKPAHVWTTCEWLQGGPNPRASCGGPCTTRVWGSPQGMLRSEQPLWEHPGARHVLPACLPTGGHGLYADARAAAHTQQEEGPERWGNVSGAHGRGGALCHLRTCWLPRGGSCSAGVGPHNGQASSPGSASGSAPRPTVLPGTCPDWASSLKAGRAWVSRLRQQPEMDTEKPQHIHIGQGQGPAGAAQGLPAFSPENPGPNQDVVSEL